MSILNRTYPHLLTVDIPVWTKFLAEHGAEFLRFDYDVRVGSGREPDPDLPDSIKKMALDLSMRRIDSIGYKPTEIWLIEITRRAGIKAVGQLLAYPILYRHTFQPTLTIVPLLVAEELHPDINNVLDAYKLPYLLFPELPPQ